VELLGLVDGSHIVDEDYHGAHILADYWPLKFEEAGLQRFDKSIDWATQSLKPELLITTNQSTI
jgi:hypothetical protein